MESNTVYTASVATFNTQGLKGNTDFVVNELVKKHDILFISEHWLSNAEKHILHIESHKLLFSPADKQPAGRPYGGNCFLIKNNLSDGIKIIHEDSHILAIQLPKLNIIIVGIYLTCFHDGSSKEAYVSQLNTISAILDMYIEESEIIVLGDYQTFPSSIYDSLPRNNPKRNPLSSLLKDFLQTNELSLVDVTGGVGPTLTYEHKTLANSSYIDHVALLKDSNMKIDECTVHEKTSNNLSDHQPITFKVTTDVRRPPTDGALTAQSSIPKFAWKDEDFLNAYNHQVINRLENCITESNLEEELLFISDILSESARTAFASVFPDRKCETFAKPWWTPALTKSKKLLSTHFNNWKSANFPKDSDNILLNRYKLARTNFRKSVKAAQNKLIHDKYMKINSLRKTDSRKFWKNMRKLKESNLRRTYNINGKKAEEDITREFADHFKTLLNNPRGTARSKYGPLPDTSDDSFVVNSTDVNEAIKLLKENKSNDIFGTLAEHYIHASSPQLSNRIANFFTGMFASGVSPFALSNTVLIPLVKSYKKSLKSPNNYRGISLIPILTKILEYVILKKCPEISQSNVSQFGFKIDSSTQHAEFLIHETVNYYNSHGSTVYMCSLDAEKAFDSCNWDILFEKLFYEKHLPLPVIKVLKSLYQRGSYKVLYNGHLSYEFGASQGVFQGSILSPHFYNAYTEEMLEHISTTANAGTMLFGTYTGIVAYADDVILMSPTLSGLQHLINECFSFYGDNAISLNIDKTEFFTSGLRTPLAPSIDMQFQQINPGEKLKHLGFVWSKQRRCGTLAGYNVQERISKFWSVIHGLIKGGIRFCQPETIIELYNTLAVPTLTYGLEIPSLTQTQMENLDTESRKAIKFLFNLSRYSKNYINNIYNINNISNIIINNKMKLISRMMNNVTTRNVILSTLQSTSSHNSTVYNCLQLAQNYQINFIDVLLNNNFSKLTTSHSNDVPEEIRQCLEFWNIGRMRKLFTDLMEERVLRLPRLDD